MNNKLPNILIDRDGEKWGLDEGGHHYSYSYPIDSDAPLTLSPEDLDRRYGPLDDGNGKTRQFWRPENGLPPYIRDDEVGEVWAMLQGDAEKRNPRYTSLEGGGWKYLDDFDDWTSYYYPEEAGEKEEEGGYRLLWDLEEALSDPSGYSIEDAMSEVESGSMIRLEGLFDNKATALEGEFWFGTVGGLSWGGLPWTGFTKLFIKQAPAPKHPWEYTKITGYVHVVTDDDLWRMYVENGKPTTRLQKINSKSGPVFMDASELVVGEYTHIPAMDRKDVLA